MPLTPYQRSAGTYVKAGWSPIPMTGANDAGAKGQPLAGFTGREGELVTSANVADLVFGAGASTHPDVSVRAHGWVGFDVDQYNGKCGADQLAEVEDDLGELPPTYRSTARGFDSQSGIRFYRIPQGTLVNAEGSNFDTYGNAIEIIRFEHRYAKCWPTVHPNGELYRWYTSDGFELPEGTVPRVENLPALPTPWLDWLCRDNRERPARDTERRSGEMRGDDDRVFPNEESVMHFLSAHRDHALSTPQGSGFNSALNAYAHALSAFVPEFFTEERALDLAFEVCEHHFGAPDAADRATVRSGLIRSRQPFYARRPTETELQDPFCPYFDGPVGLAPRFFAAQHAEALAHRIDPEDPEYDFEVANRVKDQESRGYFLDDEFFSDPEFPAFAHLRQAAHSRMASPDATMVAAMVRTAAYIGPQVRIPPWVGSTASLNFGAVIVGDSGASKSSSVGTAEEALGFGDAHRQSVPLPEYHTFCPSSPQGIAAQYQRYVRGALERTRLTAICDVDEGDQLRAVWEKQGIGIIAELRKALMGKSLGFGNVGETRTNLPGHSYRFAFILCTLPTHADWIVSDDVGGFPQRLVWACAEDSRVVDDIPWPGKWIVRIPSGMHVDLANVGVCEVMLTGEPRVQIEIRADHKRRRQLGLAEGDLDGHATLTREKVAWIFALMHGRTHIRYDHEWRAAGVFMASSNAARAYTRGLISERDTREAEKVAIGRGKMRATEEKVVVQSREQELRSAVTRRVIGYVHSQPGISKSELRKKFDTVTRPYLGDRANPQVLDALLQTGQIRFEDILKGEKVVGSRWFPADHKEEPRGDPFA